MVSVAFQLREEVTANAQRDSLKDAREVCTDGTYIPNNLHISYETRGIFNSTCYPGVNIGTFL
jgi:hypothetical protein